MTALDGSLGKRIKSYRQTKGWTQDELAKLVGVSRQAISEAERGVTTPRTLLLERLARELGVAITDLLPGTRPKTSPDSSLARPLDGLPQVRQRKDGALIVRWPRAFVLTDRDRAAVARLMEAELTILRDDRDARDG